MVDPMMYERSPHKNQVSQTSDSATIDLLQKVTLGELFEHAEKLQASGDAASSATLYKNWIACNASSELLYAAYYNYGVALDKSGDRLGAVNATRETIRLNQDFHQPYINLARLLEDSGQVGDAVLQYQDLANRLRGINGPSVKIKLVALHQLARVLETHKLDGPAEETLKHSLEISIAQPEVIQHWISLRLRQCKWPVVAGWDPSQSGTIVSGISPLSLANYADEPIFQLSRAWKYNKDCIKPPANPRSLKIHTPGLERQRSKLRIGYVSSDFREHAVGFAMTEVFEQHDRNQFEIFAYYCGIDRVDPTRLRIMASSDSWIDINGLSDEQAAAKIREDAVDILVDLNGYTKDARTRVFSFRPAPIAVNWFGYPGSMGSPYHHYIIADDQIIPPGHEIYYSESVKRLSCYQPNDRKRKVSASVPIRSDERLPEDVFVYCCLNGVQKITSQIFECWITILSQVPASVLWLLGGADDTNARLRGLAAQEGVSPERLIFAGMKPNPEHLARYALADLFLDTFPYGAHTTAADAMWMGVPILTIPGKSFASRVCASLANAAGLGELVCPTREAYVARAIEFGANPDRLSKYREILSLGRKTSVLFDTSRCVRELENAYGMMWQEFEAGRRPIPDLSNMDIYHEIGIELVLEDKIPSAEEDYHLLYKDKLLVRDIVSPIKADARLWSGKS
jgi:predicted O-linked N-acetylglucosamine transferase (SPINDLY family)